jgi:hypothetical protein
MRVVADGDPRAVSVRRLHLSESTNSCDDFQFLGGGLISLVRTSSVRALLLPNHPAKRAA